ncbi:hypothetical protein Q9L42_009830 [Methylomarinum sp. Ch1-1]|uniref:Uncharacterized protein n=1 Tax=Methylomarinum roseum TaxID=3067653 RepID=A0AAU7NZJ0_9GAMM|nr:hypothetical protein [Methylomarinum sp. Ch1-1]MDP4521455.1 hypothetical protein [Methylomarinum sp. Ch1-1]
MPKLISEIEHKAQIFLTISKASSAAVAAKNPIGQAADPHIVVIQVKFIGQTKTAASRFVMLLTKKLR